VTTAADLSLIVANARIPTGDSSRPWATALGIRGGKLAVVGTSAEIFKMARGTTEIIDAGGQQLALPAGVTVGSEMAVAVAPDGRVTLMTSGSGQ
jgi:N-acyl-D-aspartate/D-glutamate deacylase